MNTLVSDSGSANPELREVERQCRGRMRRRKMLVYGLRIAVLVVTLADGNWPAS